MVYSVIAHTDDGRDKMRNGAGYLDGRLGEEMEPLSKIANLALDEVTNGGFSQLPKLAITGLLNDFQYSWLQRFDIPYDFRMLDVARRLCGGRNREVFKATQCNDIEGIRKAFSAYIDKWHKTDDRVILYVGFDGTKINAEWVEMAEYLKSKKATEGI